MSIVKEKYFLGIPRYENYNKSMVQNYVQVDRAKQFEYIVMKDPMKKHTMFIVVIDRRKVRRQLLSLCYPLLNMDATSGCKGCTCSPLNLKMMTSRLYK